MALALIGPGIDASHNYERTHLDALVGTTTGYWPICWIREEREWRRVNQASRTVESFHQSLFTIHLLNRSRSQS